MNKFNTASYFSGISHVIVSIIVEIASSKCIQFEGRLEGNSFWHPCSIFYMTKFFILFQTGIVCECALGLQVILSI